MEELGQDYMTQCNQYMSNRIGGKRDTLNPYRIGVKLILDRLVWDLSFQSFYYRKKLKGLSNLYQGEKAVIVCNGPSLNKIDFSLLQGVYTFGLNKINLLSDEFNFQPSSIVAVNPFVIEQNKDFYSSTNIPLFLDAMNSKRLISKRKNINLIHSCDFPYFSRDCTFSVFQGYTVTYVALQLAYYMGFSSVAIIGLDHNYQIKGCPNAVVKSDGNDIGHFDSSYFSKDQLWQLPDLKASEHYYNLANSSFKEDGRNIFNASIDTDLDVFPKITLEEFIGNE